MYCLLAARAARIKPEELQNIFRIASDVAAKNLTSDLTATLRQARV
jgi:hypothetical protein